MPALSFVAAPAPVPAPASRDPQSAGALSGPIGEFGFEILNRQAADQVVQQAMIDVNEHGIEAAAAAAEVMAGAASPDRNIDFHVNRPFLAVLTQNNADVPLFMAIVRDPR